MDVGLALSPDDAHRQAILPLLERGLVDALEWTYEQGWGPPLPAWTEGLLAHFAAQGRLWAHGVGLSVLSAVHEPRHGRWLERVAAESRARRWPGALRGISEHLGFVTTPGLEDGAPLPVPRTPGAVAVGRDRLARLGAAAGAPVGLENLALALSARDVDAQGPLLEELLAPPLDGYLVLDLHNLWCQAVNFERDPARLLETYPLARARVLHVSGGSWSRPRADARARPFRRDTHDGAVPDEVFALLAEALPCAPAVEVVVHERLPGPRGRLAEPGEAERFREDHERLVAAVRDARPRAASTWSAPVAPAGAPVEDAPLAAWQRLLLDALRAPGAEHDPAGVREALLRGCPAALRDEAHALEPRALEVAAQLVRAWTR